MDFDDFYVKEFPWDETSGRTATIDMTLVRNFAKAPIEGDDDLESTKSLLLVARSEFQAFGTDGTHGLRDAESRELLDAARAGLRRNHIPHDFPWRDFPTFRQYWLAHEGRNSWGARRAMLSDAFEPAMEAIEERQVSKETQTLAVPVTPHAELGWESVDRHVRELRETFAVARTPLDYKDVGNRCVGVLEELSRQVYDPILHCPSGQTPPPVDKTNLRIGAYLEEKLPGPSNAELRRLSKLASELAHKTKHSPSANRTSAGIGADTVILLANILRRLDEDDSRHW